MSDVCSGCQRPQAHTFVEYREGNMCGIELPRAECNDTDMLLLNCAEVEIDRLRSEVATLCAQLAAAEKVVEAARGMREQMYCCNGGNCGANADAFDAALTGLERARAKP